MVWVLLVLSAAVGMALLMRFNHGNVAVLWPPYRIDLSVNLSVLVLVVVFLALHLLLLGLGKALDLPGRVREYRTRRQRDGAIASLRDSLLAYFEGRFGRAERLAQAARADADLAGAAALIGARAAHRMREFERRDRWLASAQGEAHTEQAQLMTTAELAVEDQRAGDAIAAIDRLHGRGARHIHSLRTAMRAYEQSGDWNNLLHVVRQLEKRDALHPAAARGLKLRALRALFARRTGDLAELRSLLGTLPLAERQTPELCEVAARAFALSGDEEQAWRLIEEGIREGVSARLLRLYEGLHKIPARERLMRAERWRERSGDHPELLLTLGRLCMEESLWGKAEEFLILALRQEESAQAHLALAQLYEQVGRNDDAGSHYRDAAKMACRTDAAD